MTATDTGVLAHGAEPGQSGTATSLPTPGDHRGSWIPTRSLVTTRLLELRKRRGLMITTLILTIGLPWLVLGLRLLFHAFAPKSYGPAGSPGVFTSLLDPMSAFGFIIAATIGATAGSTDLTDGMFRHLVITGRSRVALYLARIPAGLAILLPLVAVAFASLCLVTAFAGTPNPKTVNVNGVSITANLSEQQLRTYLVDHPGTTGAVIFTGPGQIYNVDRFIDRHISSIYSLYSANQTSQFNPTAGEMTKVGLWLELDILIGFLVGLGLGSLFGQRTVVVTLLIVLEIIITPIMSHASIPYFINGQRLFFGVAMDQLKPAVLSGGRIGVAGGGGGGPRHVLLGGGGGLGIAPMPTWAMISVIVGWIVVWSVVGVWRMATRDA